MGFNIATKGRVCHILSNNVKRREADRTLDDVTRALYV
jgi:hypothetical protein